MPGFIPGPAIAGTLAANRERGGGAFKTIRGGLRVTGNSVKKRLLDPHFALGPPGHVTATYLKGQRGQTVRNIQQALKAHGYDVGEIDGVAGPNTLRALGYYNMGVKPGKVAAVQARAASNEADIHGGKAQGPPPALKTKVAAAKKIAAKSGQAGKVSGAVQSGTSLGGLGNGIVGTMLQPSYADAIAGEQYDPTIHDLGIQKARQPVQEAQDLSDIKNFYAQVLGSQKKAAGQDSAISKAGQDSVQQAVQAIIGSIGGSANVGSSTVGAAGASDLGTLQALAQNNDQYNQDIAPLLAAEGAAAGTREINAQNTQAQDIATKIQDALGARGQAKAKAMGDITQANNALAQTRFQNRVALLNTAGAAQLAGLKLQGQQLSNLYKVSQIKKNYRTANGNVGWLGLKNSDKLAAVQRALSPYMDPTTGALLVDPNHAANAAREALRGMGFSSARSLTYRGPGVDPRARAQIVQLLNSQIKGSQSRIGYKPPA